MTKRDYPTTRLLTLTGVGGTGKTRLSLQVASELLDHFPDGVWFVEFAPLSDPALVPQAVATVLGVREAPGRSMLDTLSDYLADKHVLLVLNNCEQLIEACAQLGIRYYTSAHHCLSSPPRVRLHLWRRRADIVAKPESKMLTVEQVKTIQSFGGP